MAVSNSELHVASRPNVMIVIRGLGIGGSEVVVRDLTRTIDRSRFNISICCLKALGAIGEELAAEGTDISVLPNSGPARPDYYTSIKLLRLIRIKRIDLVHSHDTHSLVDSAICRCIVPRIRTVHTFHFGNYLHVKSKILWMERMSSRIADQLIAVGETQKKQINASHWLPDSAIGVVRNGVQSAKIHYRNPDFRSKIGAESKILVGTIATMIPQKGLHDLLALARRVRDAIRNVHFVVVGEGVMRSDLERLRSQLGLENTVTFAGWIMNASSVALPEFDIYIQPSLWEAMSISILEAMAAGKPVIATQVGEASYMISHGSEGFLYAARDIEGMASGVLRLAENENLRRSMGVAAARKVADRFTVDHMTRAYETIYLNTMKKVIDRVT